MKRNIWAQSFSQFSKKEEDLSKQVSLKMILRASVKLNSLSQQDWQSKPKPKKKKTKLFKSRPEVVKAKICHNHRNL
jgi:hypothetical protein